MQKYNLNIKLYKVRMKKSQIEKLKMCCQKSWVVCVRI